MIVKYFKPDEFACKCGCGVHEVSVALIVRLELLRRIVNRPLVITSGRRCVSHNEAVGGASMSRHLYGRAADIRWNGGPAFLEACREAFREAACECIPGTGYIHVSLPVTESTAPMWDGGEIEGV